MIGLKLAAAGGFGLALLSIYPGVWVDLTYWALLASFRWLPVLVLLGLALAVRRAMWPRARRLPTPLAVDPLPAEPPKIRRRPIFGAAALWSLALAVSLGLIVDGIPRRLAFLASRPAFRALVATAPKGDAGGKPLGRYLGLYHVDRYAADPRGGVYFRTHAGADGIGPDTMSYGFAYKPNPDGTPFGRAGYSLRRTVGDWYVFSASNDW